MSDLHAAESMARENGFESFQALLRASRFIPVPGPPQFLATSPDGCRFLWGADDIAGSDQFVRPMVAAPPAAFVRVGRSKRQRSA
jgi:hypothetical protein